MKTEKPVLYKHGKLPFRSVKNCREVFTEKVSSTQQTKSKVEVKNFLTSFFGNNPQYPRLQIVILVKLRMSPAVAANGIWIHVGIQIPVEMGMRNPPAASVWAFRMHLWLFSW